MLKLAKEILKNLGYHRLPITGTFSTIEISESRLFIGELENPGKNNSCILYIAILGTNMG